jgi:hypothetical protein
MHEHGAAKYIKYVQSTSVTAVPNVLLFYSILLHSINILEKIKEILKYLK